MRPIQSALRAARAGCVHPLLSGNRRDVNQSAGTGVQQRDVNGL